MSRHRSVTWVNVIRCGKSRRRYGSLVEVDVYLFAVEGRYSCDFGLAHKCVWWWHFGDIVVVWVTLKGPHCLWITYFKTYPRRRPSAILSSGIRANTHLSISFICWGPSLRTYIPKARVDSLFVGTQKLPNGPGRGRTLYHSLAQPYFF